MSLAVKSLCCLQKIVSGGFIHIASFLECPQLSANSCALCVSECGGAYGVLPGTGVCEVEGRSSQYTHYNKLDYTTGECLCGKCRFSVRGSSLQNKICTQILKKIEKAKEK